MLTGTGELRISWTLCTKDKFERKSFKAVSRAKRVEDEVGRMKQYNSDAQIK